jgi:hypothetical protein
MVAASSTKEEPPPSFVPASFAQPAPVVAGTQYALVVYSAAPLEQGQPPYRWWRSSTDPCAGGSEWSSPTEVPTTWVGPSPFDKAFKTYVTPAAKCQQGDNDDHNGGGDNDEQDGRSGAKSKLALSGFTELLVKSVQSDECDNDQHDRNGDGDHGGSDGDQSRPGVEGEVFVLAGATRAEATAPSGAPPFGRAGWDHPRALTTPLTRPAPSWMTTDPPS